MYSEALQSAFPAVPVGLCCWWGLKFGAWADPSQGRRLSLFLCRQCPGNSPFGAFWPAVANLPATARVHFLSAWLRCEYASQRELLDVLLLEGVKERLCNTGGQSFCQCFRRAGGMSQHFSGTGFSFSHKPPAGWAATDSNMTEVEAKTGYPVRVSFYVFVCLGKWVCVKVVSRDFNRVGFSKSCSSDDSLPPCYSSFSGCNDGGGKVCKAGFGLLEVGSVMALPTDGEQWCHRHWSLNWQQSSWGIPKRTCQC